MTPGSAPVSHAPRNVLANPGNVRLLRWIQMAIKHPEHAQPGGAAWLSALTVLWACGPSEDDRRIGERWLSCEECDHRELDSVRSRGNRIVPVFREALK